MAKKSKTKDEQAWLNRVAALGCIVCQRDAEIHHIGNGAMGMRASNYDVIPLCPEHHRTGGHGVAVHAGKLTWDKIHGTERELLDKVKKVIQEKEIDSWVDLIEGDES